MLQVHSVARWSLLLKQNVCHWIRKLLLSLTIKIGEQCYCRSGYQPSDILLEAKLSQSWSIKSKSINHLSKRKGVVLHVPYSLHVQNSSLHVSWRLSSPLHQAILRLLCPTTCYARILRMIAFHMLTDNCSYAFILKTQVEPNMT